MRLPNWLTDRLIAFAMRRIWQTSPDQVIGGADAPYLLRRFVIPRNRWFNVYLHTIQRSDDDRALHDHPWLFNASIILCGAYDEVTEHEGVQARAMRIAGDLVFRGASAHRLEVVRGPVWTLFVTGPRVREWGFICPRGWVHWRKFTDPTDSGKIGPGCGEP